jgi:hypothetical protein
MEEELNMTHHRNFHSLLMASCACLGLICTSSVFAQQDDSQTPRLGDEQQQRSTQRQGQRQGRQQQQAELPQFLQELDLSDEQETQIRQALQEHNQKLRRTWRQFHTTHAEAVNLEAAWTAAVRDSLSEEDQRRFDQQRMQEQQTSRSSSGRDDAQRRQRGSQRQDEDGNRRSNRRQDDADRRQDERDESSEQRAENRDQNRRSTTQRRGQESDRAADSGRREAVGLIIVTTSSPERFLEGTNQTPQQKQQCDKACREYQQKLSSVWSDLHQLHHELVKIEADRIQAIEEQLTEEQLSKLTESRQQPQDSQRQDSQRQDRQRPDRQDPESSSSPQSR